MPSKWEVRLKFSLGGPYTHLDLCDRTTFRTIQSDATVPYKPVQKPEDLGSGEVS